MTSYFVSVSDTGFDHFIRTGTLDVRSYDRSKLPKTNDCVYVAKNKESCAYGPFHVINDIPRPYAFANVPSIVCEANGIISRVEVEPMEVSTIRIAIIQEDAESLDFPSITGNLELDGLLSTALYDLKLKTYFVLMLSSNKDLTQYYHNLLNQYDIEHYYDNTGRLFIMSEAICKKCIQIDREYYCSCRSFVSGMMAPIMLSRKPLERILRDTPSEFNTAIILPDEFEYPRMNMLEGCGIIVTDSPYGIKRISGLSVRLHPFCHLLNDTEVIEEKSKPAIAGMDKYRLGASEVIVRNMFRLCGYHVDSVEPGVVHVCGKGINYYVIILKNIDDICKHQKNFERHREDGCLLILNNSQDCYLKIVKNIDISNRGVSETDLHLFHNFERNEIIPVSTILVSELRHKIHMIWE